MFKNKVVLVTGGSSGIGAATAELFAKEGATVVIVGRNETKLNEVAKRCKKDSTDVYIIKADVSKDEEVDTIVKQTVYKYKKLDVLVNNAGMLRTANILDDNFLDVFDEVMNVNIRGLARITRHAAPFLIESKGNVVNISSICATKVMEGVNFTAYSTFKAALNHFTRCIASELAKFGVRVNSVSPGPVDTNIFEESQMKTKDLTAYTALKRVSESDEVAELIVYLASDRAKGITGSDYVIDNGVKVKG